MHAIYENDQVRKMLEQFREDNFKPSYVMLAGEIDLAYTYIMDWKDGRKDMGQDGLTKVVTFIEKNSK